MAVVTGAGSGIGRALAQALAHAGAELAISDINQQSLEETAELCGKVPLRTYRVDTGSRQAVYNHAEEVIRDFGRVNLVINNAGVALTATVLEMTDEDFEWLMNINFWGMAHGSRAFLPYLIASGEGHLVNISSIFGIVSVPKNAAYNASKFAIRGFTEALRQEMLLEKKPVGVSCVHPGGIRTNIAVYGRSGPSEAGRDAAAIFARIAKTTPEKAAQVILRGVQRNQGRIFIGYDAYQMDWLQRLMGMAYEKIIVPEYLRRVKQH
ncbi:MAG TPA: SDR family NAD(P)-dependent oxidoreductase [Gemmatales bacterium]|nr:SDR family NAD(P)-dependent oxidoreductase [Gemmatales bacterium]